MGIVRKLYTSLINSGYEVQTVEVASNDDIGLCCRGSTLRGKFGWELPTPKDRQNGKSKSKKRLPQEILDFLSSGLHDHAAAPNVTILTAENNNHFRKRIAKANQLSTTSEKMVIKKHWNDDGAVLWSNNVVPIHFRGNVPDEVLTFCMDLQLELLGKKQGTMIIKADEVNSGYFRGHLSKKTTSDLVSLDIMPAGFMIKDIASQQSIVFFNNKDGSSSCHFDRDSSLLYLVQGHKVVKIAPPMTGLGRPESGNVCLDPFSLDDNDHGGHQWEEVVMVPGSVSVLSASSILPSCFTPLIIIFFDRLFLFLNIGCTA